MSQPQLQPQQPDLTTAFQTFQHYTALGFLIGAPILIALPPRKLDFYTFALASSFALSANHLYQKRQSPFSGPHASQAANGKQAGKAAKSKYEMVQEQFRRERQEESRRRHLLELPPNGTAEQGDGGGEEDMEGHRRPKTGIGRGLEKIWMGSEKAGWRERRLAEEQEKISRGKGYGGMIMDQIWEVWNWGREKGEELEEKDREVVRDRRRREEFPVIGKEKGGG